MNKRIFIGIMMFSVMIMGISFAKWNEGILVSGTVSSGYLDIETIPGCISQPIYMETSIGSVVDSDNLEVAIFDFYPGAEVDFDFEVKNVGTLGVVLDDITLTRENASSDDLDDYIKKEYSTDGINYVTLEVFESSLKTNILGIDEYTKFYVQIKFDPENLLVAEEFENENTRYRLEINYIQFNEVD